MSKLEGSIIHVRWLDDLARQDSPVHRLHPLPKLLTTLAYVVAVVSFGRYAVVELLPFVLYPWLMIVLADIPARPLLRRVVLVEPLIIGIGALNPLFDRGIVSLGGWTVAGGWLTFASILLKSSLTVTACLLLIATTGIDRLGAALRTLRIPRLFVLQLLLTYRYLAVLGEEAERMYRAYALRAPSRKGLEPSAWGSFIGQLVLRTFDRAQRVYQAMTLRGFDGEYPVGAARPAERAAWFFLPGWLLFFLGCRLFNIPALIGHLFVGV
jgi:cobalt/nickel transport system permease protein